MGLRTTLQTNIGKAFNGSLSDAVSKYTLYKTDDKHYNPILGNVDSTKAIVASSRGVFDRSNTNSIFDSSEKPSDTLVITLANEIEVIPEVEDTIIHSNGKCYKIINVEIDPANAAYFMYCRSAD